MEIVMQHFKTVLLGTMLMAAPPALLMAAPPALAQATGGYSSASIGTTDGARPGNDIGTRESLPLSPVASNINQADTRSTIAPTPPEPSVGADAPVGALLRSASQSIAAGQTGAADEALEQAETQILQRSVPQTQVDYTSNNPVVAQIEQARQALGNRDNAGATQLINQILASGAPELGAD